MRFVNRGNEAGEDERYDRIGLVHCAVQSMENDSRIRGLMICLAKGSDMIPCNVKCLQCGRITSPLPPLENSVDEEEEEEVDEDMVDVIDLVDVDPGVNEYWSIVSLSGQ